MKPLILYVLAVNANFLIRALLPNYSLPLSQGTFAYTNQKYPYEKLFKFSIAKFIHGNFFCVIQLKCTKC